MPMTVYDQLAYAIQAVMAEKEVSESARADKLRAALEAFGHADSLRGFIEALGKHHDTGRKPH